MGLEEYLMGLLTWSFGQFGARRLTKTFAHIRGI